MTDKQKQVIDAFEKAHEKSKIEYGTLVNADGDTLIVQRGGSGSVRMPTYLYNQAEVMSHNHPRAGANEQGCLGGTFSDGDLSTFSGTNVTVMRASASEGSYTIIKGRNFDPVKFNSFAKGELSGARADYKKKTSEIKDKAFKERWDYSKLKSETDKAFNSYLVDRHNRLLAGQKQYGYEYGLERRK